MKNKFLLLGATAILSTGALMANAAELGVQINTRVAMLKDFSMEELEELSFGSIVNPEANQLVVVNPDGTLGAGTTATVTNLQVKENDKTVNYTIHNGLIGVSGYPLDEVGTIYKLVLPKKIILKDGTKICGEVTALTSSDYSGGAGEFTYGGTFKVDENITAVPEAGVYCKATETVTVVIDATDLE